MITKFSSEEFTKVAFVGENGASIKMSSACKNGGGGGCYQCKCSPKKEVNLNKGGVYVI